MHVEIPADQLSAAALDGLIEEFVTREGTDYGEGDFSLDDKKRAVRLQINKGDVVILYDAENQTCNLVLRTELPTP